MLNSDYLSHLFWVGVLVVLQVFFFANMDFMNFANPFIYLHFILFFPFRANRNWFLIASAIMGFSIDFLENTGGIHAFATVFVGFFRWPLVQILHGGEIEREEFHLKLFNWAQWVVYVLVIIFVHHLLFYSLERFDLGFWLVILKNTALSGLFTAAIIGLYLVLFIKRDTQE